MDLEQQYGCHNYAPIPVVLEKGQGLYVWDVDGKKYMDFLAAYSAVNQGHVHPKIKKVFEEEVNKVNLVSRAFYSKNLGITQQYLHDTFGYDKALLMNTGCEGVESAVKFARRWAYEVKKVPSNEARICFAKGNFWGRSIAACGSSEDPGRHHNFGPFGLNFDLVEYNDIEAMRKQLDSSPNYGAVVLESIQGERGVFIPNQGYIKQVKQLCEERNILLVIDEVQTGLGRTGKLLNHYWDEVRPDMVVMGKALSGGYYPVSCLLADDAVMNCIRPGDHGSTYGGNPLAAALAKVSIEVLIEEGMIENSRIQGERLLKGLQQHKRDYIEDIRGRGLFVALQMKKDAPFSAYDLCIKMKDKGLLAKPTHQTTIRFSPPLVVNQQEIDRAIEIVQESLNELEKEKL
ncbi:Pyridoxal phosphate-dependent transferase [Pseudocohnilembus persalinus]|uniref:Ornithine aminotransferase n=1 Tax=Pseudocohnilembus persalinus TaxID=266149 RepID=A0A0V0R8S6_PSEPJ|nr:Pyridoxal phosphate-dependent transferase [Pseudocohnilembus persalinus]|eukprot:KRX10881.1 Pyridoxal phosphate-dependent transferase [Pseudocohnilembus persalinus]